MYRSFEELEVWQRSSRIAVRVYELTRGDFDRGLKHQMTRAAVSIASNVAEGAERNSAKEFARFLYIARGSARNSAKEFARFLYIARGSAAELRTQVYIAFKMSLLTKEVKNGLVSELTEISKMLFGFAQSLKT